MPEQALSDLKVIDLTHYIAGPYCTKLMADFGADVVKVERVDGGDPARRLPPFFRDEPHQEGSGTFLYLNTNKKGVTLNLKHRLGIKMLKKLLRDTDVLVENFHPRVMPSLGLSYEAVRQINPRIIMVSISNFGQTGPYRDYPATNLTLEALGGAMNTGLGGRPPYKMGGSQAEMMAGRVACTATMGAVFGRDMTGEGQCVDISIMETVASNDLVNVTTYSYLGLAKRARPKKRIRGSGGSGMYMAKDGWVGVTPGVGGLPKLARLLGDPSLENHPWFVDHALRGQHAQEFDEQFMFPYFKEHGRHEIVEKAQDLGMQFTTAIGIDELLEEPQFVAREFFVEVDHPHTGKVKYPGASYKMGETPFKAGRAPLLGEHNREIYGQRLGYSNDELQRLRGLGVI